MSMNSKLNLKEKRGRNVPCQTLNSSTRHRIKTIWSKSKNRPTVESKPSDKRGLLYFNFIEVTALYRI